MKTEKRLSLVILGVVVIVAGIGYAAQAMGFLENFTVFFDGWWAVLFIIIPSFCSLFERGSNKFWCVSGILVGTALLLWRQGLLQLSLGKLIFAIIVISIGINIIISAISGHKHGGKQNHNGYTDVDTSVAYPQYTASFGECHPNYSGQFFAGCKAEASFGQMCLDLRNAVLQNESNIEASAVFGQTEIILPQNCILDLHSSSAFGAVNNIHINPDSPDSPIVHINANAVFGDVDIK